MVMLMCGSIGFSSCIGSFPLSRKLLNWNQNIGSKFANVVEFFLFWVLPVYVVSVIADVLVLNSIEFWGGGNPVASNDVGKVQHIKGKDGNYLVKRNADGYEVTNEDKNVTVELKYDEKEDSWSVLADGRSTKFMSFIDQDHVLIYLPHGETMEVELSQAGVMAFRNAIESDAAFMAVR